MGWLRPDVDSSHGIAARERVGGPHAVRSLFTARFRCRFRLEIQHPRQRSGSLWRMHVRSAAPFTAM